MPNSFNAKITKRGGGPSPGTPRSTSQHVGPVKERTAAWPTPGPTWKTSFNVKTRVPVVKTRARKHGID